MNEQDTGQDADRTPESSPVLPPETLLTVAEAARWLGIDPKQVRRYASKLTGQDRTPPDVSPLRVRLSAVKALRAGINPEPDASKDKGQDRTRDRGRTRQDTVPSEAQSGLLPALVYQHRIGDLEAQITELKADKERLYSLLEAAQANLSREQALRSLPAPEPEALHPEPAQAAAEVKAENSGDAEIEKKPGFWQKLFGGV